MAARVVHVTSKHPPNDPRIFRKECRSLARAGYDVTLLVAQEAVPESAEVRIISAGPRIRGNLWRLLRRVWSVLRAALRQRPALFHLHDPDLFPVGLVLRTLGMRVVYDAHEDFPRQFVAGLARRFRMPAFFWKATAAIAELGEESCMRCFSGLVAATPFIGERLRRLNANCEVVMNYPEIERFKGSPGARARSAGNALVYVGALSAGRGILEMIEALERLPQELNVRLNLAGAFSPEELAEEAKALPGWRRVDFHGYAEEDSVLRLLGASRIGLAVLHPEPNYLKGHPTKLFEYMAAGIPVIASDFPLWRGIVEGAGCGLLVDPLDVRSVVEAIERLLRHPEEADAMGKRGREAVEKRYNWSFEEEKLLDLYRRLA